MFLHRSFMQMPDLDQIKFNPAQPQLLYASQRRSDEILCWDVRQPFEVLCNFRRKASNSNQKLLFDIDPSGQWLASGDEVMTPEIEYIYITLADLAQEGNMCLFDLYGGSSEAALQFQAHNGLAIWFLGSVI